MSEKVHSQHLARKAVLYVRQSSAYQMMHNVESQKLQYAMKERLQQLGWHEIEVVDEDMGRSAAGTVTRSGFERMVAEVCLWPSRRCSCARSLALRSQQPRMAAARGGLPGSRHAAH
jgi:hypothetical protein